MLNAVDTAITQYYDSAPEETRLEHGTSRLEALRTRELIERHAPPRPARVLDVGGGAGPYAFWLAEMGYEVHLVDASRRLVDVALERNSGATHPLASCRVGDARSLSEEADSVDAVLMLGPLYHLVDPAERRVALGEALRVLKMGGYFFGAAISRAASALDGLSRDLFRDPSFARIVERGIHDGQHRNGTKNLDYFTTAYLHRPEELRMEVEGAGLRVHAVYGIEGPGWMLGDFDQRWDDPQRRDALVAVARMLEREPSLVGASAHLLVVARKEPPRVSGPNPMTAASP